MDRFDELMEADLPRFWDSEAKEMIYPERSRISGKVYTYSWNGGQCCGLDFMYKNSRFIRMRPTGLKDRNGNSLYEGDITKTTLSDWSIMYHLIRWDVEGARFIADYSCNYNPQTAENYCTIYKDWLEIKEITGNIHQNPELLKGGAE